MKTLPERVTLRDKMKGRLVKEKHGSLANPDRQWTVGKEGLLLSHWETERQDADEEGVLAPQLSVPVGGDDLNGESGRE